MACSFPSKGRKKGKRKWRQDEEREKSLMGVRHLASSVFRQGKRNGSLRGMRWDGGRLLIFVEI
jgi:hypothetical protein